MKTHVRFVGQGKEVPRFPCREYSPAQIARINVFMTENRVSFSQAVVMMGEKPALVHLDGDRVPVDWPELRTQQVARKRGGYK